MNTPYQISRYPELKTPRNFALLLFVVLSYPLPQTPGCPSDNLPHFGVSQGEFVEIAVGQGTKG